ncbi:signal recognition particle-docking protein FtsY [Alphaproteobacteria bacterium LSUCC0684]
MAIFGFLKKLTGKDKAEKAAADETLPESDAAEEAAAADAPETADAPEAADTDVVETPAPRAEDLPPAPESVPAESPAEMPVPDDLPPEDTTPEDTVPEDAAPETPAPEADISEDTGPDKVGKSLPEDAEIASAGGEDTAEDPAPEDAVLPEDEPSVETPAETPVPDDLPAEDAAPEDTVPEDPAPESAAPEPPAPDAGDKADEPSPEPARKSWFGRLKEGLGKSASKITEGLAGIMGKPKLDAADLDEIEDALIMADLGVAAAGRLTEGLKGRSYPDGVNAATLAEALAEEVGAILAPVAKPLEIRAENKPHVVLMVGVNGSGKTTTAGKLAEYWRSEGRSVMLAAADTFRAAAVEQLKIWGERTGTTVIAGEPNADAAAVAYQAHEAAIREKVDVLIVDTAGRLQARAELMEELGKITRVLGKQDAAAPHDSIIVLDGTVGQNALSQVAAFQEVANLSGMIVTKLDGSARGGVVVALAEEFGLPIHAVGVGEGKDDLRPFDAADFGRALAGLGNT